MTSNISSTPDPFDRVCSQPTKPMLIVYTIFLVLIMAATIFGNALVITAVYLSYRLRRMTNFFIISLAVSDLLVGLGHLPLRIDMSVHNFNWCFDRASGVVTTCAYWIVMDTVFSSASICNLAVISIDRFLAITKPFDYQTKMTNRVGFSLIAFVWVYAMLWGVLSLVDWTGSTAPDRRHIAVYFDPTGERRCGKNDRLYYTVAMALAFFLPLLVVIIAYSCVFRVAFTQAKAVASLDPNKNQRRILRELKATKTIAIVIGCFIVSWLPFFIVTVISLWCTKCMQPFITSRALSYFVRISFVFVLPVINSSLNPLIYTVFNKEFRNAFKKMLCRRRWAAAGSAGGGDTMDEMSVTDATTARLNPPSKNSRSRSWMGMNGRDNRPS